VTLEHVRRARHMTLANDLRMERDMVRNCFRCGPARRRDLRRHTRAGDRQGPRAALESGAHRGRHAGDGAGVLRQPVAGACASLRALA
jgi:hypothetical protein